MIKHKNMKNLHNEIAQHIKKGIDSTSFMAWGLMLIGKFLTYLFEKKILNDQIVRDFLKEESQYDEDTFDNALKLTNLAIEVGKLFEDPPKPDSEQKAKKTQEKKSSTVKSSSDTLTVPGTTLDKHRPPDTTNIHYIFQIPEFNAVRVFSTTIN